MGRTEQDFIEDIVHDLNNAVFAILTFAALAQAGVPTGHPVGADLEEIARAAEQARLSLDRLTTILG